MLLACSPFVLLELGLRLAGQPATMEGVDDDPIVDLNQLKPLFELNKHSDEYEIPESRRNFFQHASFPANKSATTRRIFVLGGSTVQGRPYAPETAFSTWLILQLQAADPKTNFEVVNCGGVSYASYRLGRVLDEVLTHQPDAIVIYSGHNEFLEERSYERVRDLGRARAIMSRIGSNLNTVRWLRSTFASKRPKQTSLTQEVDARLDHAGGLDSYHRDNDWRRGVEKHFGWTLQKMVQQLSDANVPVILCRPASDVVNTPPIKTESLVSYNKSHNDLFQNNLALARDANRSASERLAFARQCIAMDDEHAGAQFIAGRLLYDQGDVIQATIHLTLARDTDVCPLRATTSIVESVNDIARQNQIPLIKTDTLLDQRSHNGTRVADGIPDPEFFIDHVHPTIAGHQIIGAALASEFEKLGWINLNDESESRYQTLAKAHLASLEESYYARGKQRLEGLKRWATGRAGELGIETASEPKLDASTTGTSQ